MLVLQTVLAMCPGDDAEPTFNNVCVQIGPIAALVSKCLHFWTRLVLKHVYV